MVAGAFGVVSLTIQIGESILKLKTLWDSVNEASDDIRNLIRELELTNMMLMAANFGDDLDAQTTNAPILIAKLCLE